MAIKKFDIVCEPYGMEFLGLKWAKDSDREFDANFIITPCCIVCNILFFRYQTATKTATRA